jgi:hypothetical protein
MEEDKLLDKAVAFFTNAGWTLAYQTRPLSQGAIAGVDAVLVRKNPWQFVFVDAKGSTTESVRRSNNFTNALGAILKRIRFEKGYIGLEARKNFIACHGLGQREIIDLLRKHAVHRNSEYVLAFDPEMVETVKTSLDPALAALLHIRVLLVDDSSTRFFQW